MGRCQGGFCGPRVAAILATELSIPSEQVTKDGDESNLIVGKTKSLVKEKANVQPRNMRNATSFSYWEWHRFFAKKKHLLLRP